MYVISLGAPVVGPLRVPRMYTYIGFHFMYTFTDLPGAAREVPICPVRSPMASLCVPVRSLACPWMSHECIYLCDASGGHLEGPWSSRESLPGPLRTLLRGPWDCLNTSQH